MTLKDVKNFKESADHFYTAESLEHDCTSSDAVEITKMIVDAPKFDDLTRATLLKQFFDQDISVAAMIDKLMEEGY